MLEIEVVFDFQCCSCGSLMGVTLRCAGEGLAHGKTALATVKVPCPHCHNNNRMIFSPDGTLHKVEAAGERRMTPTPSLN